jgi:hypothetical protein
MVFTVSISICGSEAILEGCNPHDFNRTRLVGSGLSGEGQLKCGNGASN